MSCASCREIEALDQVRPDCESGGCPIPRATGRGMRAVALRSMIRRLKRIVPAGEVLRLMGATARDLELLALIEDEIGGRG